jgi:hypothetical protein
MKKLPKGIKKKIRKEKTRINRDIFDKKKRKEAIDELYSGIVKRNENKRDSQSSDK